MPLQVDPFSIYRTLRAINPSPYLFFIRMGEESVLVGASPEILVRLEGNQVLGVDDVALLRDLTPLQQRRAAAGFRNPFFWAGIELMGAPW